MMFPAITSLVAMLGVVRRNKSAHPPTIGPCVSPSMGFVDSDVRVSMASVSPAACF